MLRALENVFCQMLPSLSLLNGQFAVTHRGPPPGKTEVAKFVFNNPPFPLWTPLSATDPLLLLQPKNGINLVTFRCLCQRYISKQTSH